MSYELEAYLAPLTALEGKQEHPVPEMIFRLTDELGLVPLCGTQNLGMYWPAGASKGTTVAHVSTHYFGGQGSQSATVWNDGEVVAENVDVNVALRHLGVQKTSSEDEWDCVGLDRFRRTETWAAHAIRAKRELGDKPLENLLEALRYTSSNRKLQEKVRAAAALDLGKLGDEAAIPDLVDATKAGGVEIEAAEALAEIGGPGLAVLAEMLREEESDRYSQWNPFRVFAKKPTKSNFEFAIIHALGEAGPAAGPFTDDVAIMLQHCHAGTRSKAAQALGKIGPAAARAVPALIEALRDEESYVRSYAAQALGEIGPAARSASQALGTCLGDEVHYVRERAKAALAMINEQSERH